MDAIIGRYRVCFEETRLLLKHPAGISFDLTLEETIALDDFINVYRRTLTTLQDESERQTDPSIKAIVLNKEEDQ